MKARVAVVGGGSAGIMAMLRTVLNNTDCLFFPGAPADKKGSRALWVRKVENVPGHFQYQKGIEEPNAEVLRWVSASSLSGRLHHMKNLGIKALSKLPNGGFELTDSSGEKHQADFVILCTGVMDVQPLFGGSMEPVFPFANAQLVDYCLRCDGHHVLGKRSAVIGHTTGAAWVSIMLYERYRPPAMYLLGHGEEFSYDDTTRELMDMYGIQRHQATITEFRGDASAGNFEGVTLENGARLNINMAFVSLGMIVYNELAQQVGATVDGRGFVAADANGLTNVAGLYVAGDLMAGTKKQIYTAWDTAVNSADAINMKIRAQDREQLLQEFRKKS